MEEGIYEVDVHSLAVKELWADEQRETGRKADLPGYHGKGFYSAQGRYVYSNNGDHAPEARKDPTVPSGVLAEWDGKADVWIVVRRNQFTDVTGPGGIAGNLPDDDRLWSIGWDNRSLILMLLDGGKWHSFRLPKASHCYDGAHGWNTEWPRIRDIGEDALLLTMHGEFWKFPKTFSAANTAGIDVSESHRRFLPLGRPAGLRLRRHGESRIPQQRPAEGQARWPGQITIQPLVRRAGRCGFIWSDARSGRGLAERRCEGWRDKHAVSVLRLRASLALSDARQRRETFLHAGSGR
jgi:hypothetical protein